MYTPIMAGQRVVGRIRLSHLTEVSTSIERQKESIEAWASTHDNTIVGWALDTDVSGSVSPFDTPELGPWLTDERQDEYDIICAAALDRMGRRVIPLNALFGWMMERDKTLVCIRDNIDLSHWVGRLIANVIAGVAEGELEAITERIKSSNKKLVELGRWPGGNPPYGHLPEKTSDGWFLIEDPEASLVIHRIAELLIEGNSVDWIRDQLNDDQILPPSEYYRQQRGKTLRGSKWTSRTIWTMMSKKTLMGHAVRYKETVRDSEGRPVLYGDPILTKEKFDQVQTALEGRRTGPVRTRNTSPLLGIGFCFDCDRQLSHRIMNRNYGQETYRYYHCFHRDCSAKVMMDAATIEELLAQHFLDDVGDEPEMLRSYIKPSDHTAELEEAQEAATEISTMLLTTKSKTVKDELRRKLEGLDTRIASLELMPVREGGWEYTPTGRTYAEAWGRTETPEDRRKFLLKYGVKLRIKQTDRTRNGSGNWHFEVQIPPDLKIRMSS